MQEAASVSYRALLRRLDIPKPRPLALFRTAYMQMVRVEPDWSTVNQHPFPTGWWNLASAAVSNGRSGRQNLTLLPFWKTVVPPAHRGPCKGGGRDPPTGRWGSAIGEKTDTSETRKVRSAVFRSGTGRKAPGGSHWRPQSKAKARLS